MQNSLLRPCSCSPLCQKAGPRKPCFVNGPRTPVSCRVQQSEHVNQGRRNMTAMLTAAPLLFMAQQASALIPANDDEDEELVNIAKKNRSKKMAEEKDTEQDFAKSAGYNGTVLLTIERGVKKLAKSASELEAGNLQSVASLASDSWVSEFQKAAESVTTKADAKTAVSTAFNSISKISSSAGAGDAKAAKQAFVGAVSSLQTWASASGLQVKGL